MYTRRTLKVAWQPGQTATMRSAVWEGWVDVKANRSPELLSALSLA
jgi:hypothetical protein